MFALDLLERLAEPFEIPLRNPDAGIRHGDVDAAAVEPRRDAHFAAARRELDAVREQIDQDLLDRALVGEDHVRLRRDGDAQGHAGAIRRLAHEPHAGFRGFLQIEDFFPQFELAGLDLRHVENAVDEFEQMGAAFVDQPRIFEIARRAHGAEHLVRHHLGKADDGVERRAQFVAHIGEEARLRAVGLFGEVARLDQRLLVDLALGDVARHRDDVAGLALGGRCRAAADLGPHECAVGALETDLGAARHVRNSSLP